MRIMLVPLDERPVNVEIPREVAAIAGVELDLPPVEALPAMRAPANLVRLHEWLVERVAEQTTTHLVVCIDTLVFGGIIPARITADTANTALERLGVLATIAKARPELVVLAVSLVMRASNSYSAVEEPEYWSQYGRELHRTGAALHHELEQDVRGSIEASDDIDTDARAVPDQILRDFELRRLRNHMVNLETMSLHESGSITALVITADDTAPYSAGSAEQIWLRHWQRALPSGRSVLMYPGADEVGAALVARALTAELGSPAISIVCGEANGLERIPNFENVPLFDSLRRQISAVGGHVAEVGEEPDLVLVAHAPDPDRGDYFGGVPKSDRYAVRATVEAVERCVRDGLPVALADVRFSNGGDPDLVDELADRGLLLALSSYGGWNTAGNSIGSALAHAVARWAGAKRGTLDETVAERALLARILEDRAYQSGIRGQLQDAVFGGNIGPVGSEVQAAAVKRITVDLQSYLQRITAGRRQWTVTDVNLPWNRSFEISFSLTSSPNG
jgi:hypothetical protein